MLSDAYGRMKGYIRQQTDSANAKSVCMNYAASYVFPLQRFLMWLGRKNVNEKIRSKCKSIAQICTVIIFDKITI